MQARNGGQASLFEERGKYATVHGIELQDGDHVRSISPT
jgi:hypothetical protein